MAHILSAEGNTGYGIDQNKRKIWDIFPDTDLRAELINVNEFKVKDGSWVIGNHADQLVPWAPIIASNSGPNTKYH